MFGSIICHMETTSLWLLVRGLGAGRANEGTLPRIRQRWTAAETNSAGSVQVFELVTWHGRGA